jgi:hypothetical protein
MKSKEEVIAIIEAKKSEAGAPFDAISAAVSEIEISGDVAALQQQVADLTQQLVDLQAAKSLEDLDLAALQTKLASDEAALAQVKAIVDALSGS